MFSAILMAPDKGIARALDQMALESKQVCVYKVMHVFPTQYELTRILNCFCPDIVLIDFSVFEDGLMAASHVRELTPQTALIGFALDCRQDQIEAAKTVGVCELLIGPASEGKFLQTVERAVQQARPAVHDNLLAFLPAKAGSGSSTIAANIAGALSRNLKHQVLFIEADLRSGIIADVLKIRADYSVVDALDTAERLDSTLWSRTVAAGQGIDLLAAPQHRGKGPVPSWANYHQLLEFVRPRYDTVVVDMPELVNEATVEIVRRAPCAYVVTTPELPSLLLARRRREELESMGLTIDRIRVVVNRWERRELSVIEISKFLGQPVAAVFPNDYASVRRANLTGRMVDPDSNLGKAFTKISSKFVNPTVVKIRESAEAETPAPARVPVG